MTGSDIGHPSASATIDQPAAIDQPTIGRRGAGPADPLDLAARRVWRAEQLSPGTPTNLVAVAANVSGPIDLVTLRTALRDAIGSAGVALAHHIDQAGEPVRRPATDDVTVPVVVTNLAQLTEKERANAAEEALTDAALTAFALDREPPLRCHLLLLPDRAVLVLVGHRIAVDDAALGAVLWQLARHFGTPGSNGASATARTGHGPTRTAADGGDPATDLAPWREPLADPPLAAPLPDRPRPPVPDGVGGSVPLAVPTDLRARLRARFPGVAEEIVLIAAAQALLARHGAGTDIPVTITAPAIGVPAELVVRTDLAGDGDFDTVLTRTVSAVTAATARPAVPFSRLAEELGGTAASIRHDPFARVALTLRREPLLPPALGGVPLTPLPLPRSGIRYELRLVLEPTADGGWTGQLEYARTLFDPASAERLASRLPLLLDAVLSTPRAPLSRLALLTRAERELTVHTWNDTTADAPPNRCLHELILEQARAFPERPAVVCDGRTLTYGELADRSGRLADALRVHRVRDRLVALSVGRSVDMVVGVLAILRAGAAWVPMDPSYPAARLAFMLADARTSVILTDRPSVDLLPPHDATVLVIDDTTRPPRPADPVDPVDPAGAVGPVGAADPVGAVGPAHSSASPNGVGSDGAMPRDEWAPLGDEPGDPGSRCYVIYTSGSTGTPKGAANTHRGVLNTMMALIGRCRIDNESRLLQCSSLSFDMSAFDILATLLAGGCLVVPRAADLTDPQRLLDLAHEARITVWSSTPALFVAAVDVAIDSGAGLPETLRSVVLGGDRFPGSVVEPLRSLAPRARAFNVAGMTEVSFTTTAHPVTVDDARRASVPWGRPLPNQRMYVLDEYGDPVPAGVPGELYIGGAGVGSGYWRRPELTAERFPPDPFVADPNARMYRTGDLARHLDDGRIEFLGRLDHQVKIRGHRIELGEVESALRAHPEIRDGVADLRTGADEQSRLTAYLVPVDQERPTTVESLRAFLGSRLPEYMIPATFVVVPRIPVTAGGKIDRAALTTLPLPTERPELACAYRPPRDGLERAVVGEWERVLGVTGIGVDDEFTALGGHSLLATATMTMISDVLRVPMSARDLFEASTPARLARRIRQLAPGRDWD